jgi:hypothetical protein
MTMMITHLFTDSHYQLLQYNVSFRRGSWQKMFEKRMA